MMLLNSANEKIDVFVGSLIKKRGQTKIVTQLYDGTYQTQDIGKMNLTAEVIVFASETKMDELNIAWALSEPLKIEKDGVFYTGYIKDSIKWDQTVRGYTAKDAMKYKGTFEFLINEVV